ncbi:hypothetical protein AB8O55_16180, partial [Saccharopolyspora cebuensis]
PDALPGVLTCPAGAPGGRWVLCDADRVRPVGRRDEPSDSASAPRLGRKAGRFGEGTAPAHRDET